MIASRAWCRFPNCPQAMRAPPVTAQRTRLRSSPLSDATQHKWLVASWSSRRSRRVAPPPSRSSVYSPPVITRAVRSARPPSSTAPHAVFLRIRRQRWRQGRQRPAYRPTWVSWLLVPSRDPNHQPSIITTSCQLEDRLPGSARRRPNGSGSRSQT